jgi:hypothetical protein
VAGGPEAAELFVDGGDEPHLPGKISRKAEAGERDEKILRHRWLPSREA